MHPTAQMIARARKTGVYMAFHRKEIVFLCKSTRLHDSHKIVWLWLARRAWDPQQGYRCFQSTIGDSLHSARGTINRAIGILAKQGFIAQRTQKNYASTYYARLPQDGMDFLAKDTLLEPMEAKTPRTLQTYRKHGHYTRLGVAEMDFVLEHPDLSDAEKLLWLFIANESAGKELSVSYSYLELAGYLNKERDTIYKLSRSLAAKDFLKFEEHPESGHHGYTLSLPAPGLEQLQAAAPRAGAKDPSTPAVGSDFFAPHSDETIQGSDAVIQGPASDDTPLGSGDTHSITNNTCNTKTITTITCNKEVEKLPLVAQPAPLSAAEAAAQRAQLAAIIKDVRQLMTPEGAKAKTGLVPSLKAEEKTAAPATSVSVATASSALSAQEKETTETIAPVPPLAQSAAVVAGPSTSESPLEAALRKVQEKAMQIQQEDPAPICPVQEPWAIPVPILDLLHPPGDENTPLSNDVGLYWRGVAYGTRIHPTPLTEVERLLIQRAERRLAVHPAPFEKGSRFEPQHRQAQALQHLQERMARGHLEHILEPEEIRHWQACFVQRSKLLGFSGELNYYVFSTFHALPQLLIRIAMRQPTPPPLPKAPPAPRYKSTYGEYPVAPTLEERIRHAVPRFIEDGEFQGAALERGADALVREILFYVAGKESASLQHERCTAAYVQCRKGKWDTPMGMHSPQPKG